MQETQETWVWSLGWEDPLEKEMATHSSILAWRIPWTEEPGGLQSMGTQSVRHDQAHMHAHAGWCWQSFALLCAWWHRSSLCLHLHVAVFPLSISILVFSSYKDTVIELGSSLNHRTGTSLSVQWPGLHVPVSFPVRELDPAFPK